MDGAASKPGLDRIGHGAREWHTLEGPRHQVAARAGRHDTDLARAPETGSNVLIADIDPAAYGAARAANAYLTDRRFGFTAAPERT